MNKYIKQLTVFAAVVFCCIVAGSIPAYAATANIEIPAQNAANGQEVKVSINVTSDQNIGTFDLRITYDASVLEYVSGADNGGSGVLQVLNSELSQTTTVTKELVFKALKEGSSDIAVQAASSNVLDMGANPMEIAGGVGTVTIGGEAGTSSDNNLTSLNVSGIDKNGNSQDVVITPAFSQDVLEYRAEVGETVEKLSVAAAVSDPAATIKISGVQLNAGDNLTKITVTASDGQIKEYKIYTVKGGVPAETTPVQENKELLPVPEDLSPVFSEKTGKYIIQTFDAVGIPEGFTQCGYNYGDRQIAALSGCNGVVTAICLADDENGTNAALFVYNQSTDSFALYNSYDMNGSPYVMLTPDQGETIPEGCEETVIQINGVDTVAWQGGMYSDYPYIYLVYATDRIGNKGFYIYDSAERVLIRYPSNVKASTESDSDLQSAYDELKKQVEDDDFVKLEIIIGYSVLCIILIIYASVLLYKLKKIKPEDEETEEGGKAELENTPELKLDMAMQANEVKTETLANDVNEILEEDKPVEETAVTNENGKSEEDSESSNVIAGETQEDVKEEKIEDSNDNQETEDLGIVFVDLEDEEKK